VKYDYVCKVCGAAFPLEFPVDASTTRIGKHVGAKCVICGSSAVRKKISQVSIVFRGKGFYSTDNAVRGKENGKENGK